MELLELKSVWDVVIEKTISKEHVDEFVVAKSIKKDSKTVLTKIKRVMFLKFFLGGLSLILCVGVLVGSFIEPEKITFYEGIFSLSDIRAFLATVIIFLAGMLSWNFRAFLKIKHFETKAVSVKESLKKFIDIMDKTIKLNIYSGVVFNSLALGWIFYIINNKKEIFTDTVEIVLMTVLIVVLGIVLSFFMNRYEQKIKFGNYLNHLKSNLEDIEENEHSQRNS